MTPTSSVVLHCTKVRYVLVSLCWVNNISKYNSFLLCVPKRSASTIIAVVAASHSHCYLLASSLDQVQVSTVCSITSSITLHWPLALILDAVVPIIDCFHHKRLGCWFCFVCFLTWWRSYWIEIVEIRKMNWNYYIELVCPVIMFLASTYGSRFVWWWI